MVMVATVRYPEPGGVSQLASLKLIMVKYSAITWTTPKAVVPHSTTASRRMRRPRTSGCHAKIQTKATTANNSMIKTSHQKRRVVSDHCPSPIATLPATASVARPGSAATALVLNRHRSPRTSVSQATRQRHRGDLQPVATAPAPRPSAANTRRRIRPVVVGLMMLPRSMLPRHGSQYR